MCDDDEVFTDLMGTTCVICQTAKSQREWLKFACGHFAHSACSAKWFLHHRECPLCRRYLGPADRGRAATSDDAEVARQLQQQIDEEDERARADGHVSPVPDPWGWDQHDEDVGGGADVGAGHEQQQQPPCARCGPHAVGGRRACRG